MVDSVLSIGLQGVNSGVARTREAAQDIASATTVDPFADNTATNNGNPGTGTPNTGAPVANRDVTADLATSLVNLKIGEYQVKASAEVIRTADEMLGFLIDVKT